jgi:hypothetical protein
VGEIIGEDTVSWGSRRGSGRGRGRRRKRVRRVEKYFVRSERSCGGWMERGEDG